MKLLYKRNWLVINYLFLILLTLLLTLFYKDFWQQSENFKDLAFKGSLWFCILSTAVWSFFNKNMLFQKKEWLRNCIVIASSCSVLLFTFKLSDAYKAIKVLLFLCIIYALWKREFIKPTLPMISFYLFSLFHILGGLWYPKKDFSFDLINDGEILFLLITTIIALFYRIKKEEAKSFITICFKGFLGLLALNIIIYSLYIVTTENSFFSFFTFNKGYLSYYEILSWTNFKHPSYISWVILLVGGLGFFLWKEEKNNRINTFELIIYAILLFFFMFMVQARITIIGYFLTIGLFVWGYISKNWKMKHKIMIFSVFLVITLGVISFLVTKTTFFSDPIRNSFFKEAFSSNHNIFFGGGTSYQRDISWRLGFGHLHNDFLSIWVDLGLTGIILCVGWIISTFYQSITTKNNYILYTLLLALMFMGTDTFLYLGSYMSVWFITIFYMEDKKIATYNKSCQI